MLARRSTQLARPFRAAPRRTFAAARHHRFPLNGMEYRTLGAKTPLLFFSRGSAGRAAAVMRVLCSVL